jgi:serine/threonine protein phosphatase PrpC
VVIVTRTKLFCASVGDSRCVLARVIDKVHTAIPLSLDHKPFNPAEQRRILEAGGFIEENRVNGNLAVSRSIGDLEYKSNEKKPAD